MKINENDDNNVDDNEEEEGNRRIKLIKISR